MLNCQMQSPSIIRSNRSSWSKVQLGNRYAYRLGESSRHCFPRVFSVSLADRERLCQLGKFMQPISLVAQNSFLLASPEAVLLRERVYFSHPRTAGVLVKGSPVLFYESGRKGGSASVTAVARIVRAELVSKDGANQELLRRGVLDKKILKNICLADTVVATTIDNIMSFRNPVALERLRALNAIDGANLVTARSIRAEQVIQIVNEGML